MKHRHIQLLLLLAGALAPVMAQDLERIEPRSAGRGDHVATVTSAEEDLGTSTASEESVGTIEGILLVSHPNEVRVDNPPDVTGVQVKEGAGDEEFIVPDGVVRALEPFINGPLSLRSVEEINRAAILAYREAGLPVVDVGFPEQNVSTGVLQLVIIIGRAGEISVEGARYFDEKIYRRSFRTTTGEVLWEAPILNDLNYLNRNPYRRVDLVYTPGDNFAEADIILRTQESRPWTVYTGYENTGTEFLGEDRFLFGGDWGNVFGLDHQFAYQYTADVDFNSLHAHAASYRIPIWQWRHEVQLLAAYVEAEGRVPVVGGPPLVSGGESVQLSASYLFPLPELFGYTAEAEVGFDFKSTNNNLEFGGLTVVNDSAETDQFFFGNIFTKSNRFGRQRISHRLVWSPGDLSNHNTDANYQRLRAFASAEYVYWHGEFAQTFDLPHGFTGLFEVGGQLADSNLLAAEAVSLGGMNSIRGFEENLILADEAIHVTAEIYAPPIPLIFGPRVSDDAKAPVTRNAAGDVRLFAFYDQAWAGNIDLLPGEPENISLGGMGLGIDCRIGEFFTARVSHGWQVEESGFTDGEHGRWHVSAITRW